MAKPVKFVVLGDASDAAKALRQVRDEADKSGSRLQKISERLVDTGKKMSIGITAPLVALGASSIQAASDLEQAVGGTEAVFGNLSSAIDKVAETSAESLGLAKDEFRTATTLIGGQLKRMTGDVGLAADASIQLVGIGADLAATYGGTTKEAVDAFAAALRGEADPAERFNLNLKISEQNAKAVELGLAANTREVDENARAQGLLALIMEQSADAQGQFAREADTAAGQQQRLVAEWRDARAELGEALLPVMVGAVGVLRDLIGWFDELPPASKRLVAGFGAAAAATGPLLIGVGKTIEAVTKLKGAKEGLVKFLGSPWSKALGAASIALGLLLIDLQNSKERTDAWVEAMREGQDALQDWTIEMIAQEIANRGWVDIMNEAGVTASDLHDAIMGDEEAMRHLNKALGDNRPILGTFLGDALSTEKAINDWARQQRDARAAAEEFLATEKDVHGELDQGAPKWATYAGGVTDYMQAAFDANDATNELANSTTRLLEEQQALVDPLFNLHKRLGDLRDAQQEYNDKVLEFGPQSREAEDAAIKLAEAQLDANAAAQRYAREGGPESLDVLRDLLIEAGLLPGAIDQIIDAIGRLNSAAITPKTIPVQGGGVSQFPVFDSGGKVPGSGPKLAVVHGGETVLPTHRMTPAAAVARQFGGGSAPSLTVHANITIGGDMPPGAARKASRELLRELDRDLRIFQAEQRRAI